MNLRRFAIIVSMLILAPSLAAEAPYVPLGLRELPIPADNPLTVAKVELGTQLFFDPRLSRDNTVSCATCHDPKKGWSNGDRFATGVRGQVGRRSAPSLVNSAYQEHQFWDGRADSLENQAGIPIEDPTEMDMPLAELAGKLNDIPGYKQQFQTAFGHDATPDTIKMAIASFVRTLLAGDSPYDRYRAGELDALSPAARRGHDIFFFRMNCRACHQGPSLTDDHFHNVGVGMDDPSPDPGRQLVTLNEEDLGKFKTPTLRDIARTAPYMHDGRFETLDEVVKFYADGGTYHTHLDLFMNVFPLDDREKSDLVAFLKEGLTSGSYPAVSPPKLPE